ncbi:MAG TPA: redoxin domain-containing protein, partial [Planctomycetaceae bacterium]|nr:redoxin domain-containing protein [Planctomycetaceae bacterium]
MLKAASTNYHLSQKKVGVSRHSLFVALGIVAVTALSSVLESAPPPDADENPPLTISAVDLAGKSHPLGVRADRAGLVLVFLSTECPIANGYLPELNRLYGELQKNGRRIDFFGVISDRTVTRAAAARHAESYKIAFPVLFDASGDVAGILRPTHTPEAFVIDRNGKLAYRGRIDDTYAALGQRRPQVNRRDLEDAMNAIAEARSVAEPRAEPVGCRFEERRGAPQNAGVTYARDIAPLLQANC